MKKAWVVKNHYGDVFSLKLYYALAAVIRGTSDDQTKLPPS